MNRRASEYWIPPTCEVDEPVERSPATRMLCAFAARGSGRCIWSARMIEIAIVISAWRRSCPWFQRRKRLLDAEADQPTQPAAIRRGSDPLPHRDLGAERARSPRRARSSAGACRRCSRRGGRTTPWAMFTTRIRPKISVKPLATTNRSRGEGDRVEEGLEEVGRVADGRAVGRLRGPEQHPRRARRSRRRPASPREAISASPRSGDQREPCVRATWTVAVGSFRAHCRSRAIEPNNPPGRIQPSLFPGRPAISRVRARARRRAPSRRAARRAACSRSRGRPSPSG